VVEVCAYEIQAAGIPQETEYVKESDGVRSSRDGDDDAIARTYQLVSLAV